MTSYIWKNENIKFGYIIPLLKEVSIDPQGFVGVFFTKKTNYFD
jgi:hypothetical protein